MAKTSAHAIGQGSRVWGQTLKSEKSRRTEERLERESRRQLNNGA